LVPPRSTPMEKSGMGRRVTESHCRMRLVEASPTREFIASPRKRGFARLAVIRFDSAKGKLWSDKMRPRQ
jgi:hypothetical protein